MVGVGVTVRVRVWVRVRVRIDLLPMAVETAEGAKARQHHLTFRG